jgi:signal transduction histidine kinase
MSSVSLKRRSPVTEVLERNPERRSRQLLRTLYVYAALTVVVAWGLGLWHLVGERQEAMVRSETVLQSIAVGVAHQVGAMLADGVGSARAASRTIGGPDGAAPMSDAEVAVALAQHLSGSSYIKSLFLLDANRFVEARLDGSMLTASMPPGWLATMSVRDDEVQWIGAPIADPLERGSIDFPVAIRVQSGQAGQAWAGAVFGSGAIQVLLEEQRLQKAVMGLYTESGMPVARVSSSRADPGQLGPAQRLVLTDAIARRWPGPVELIGPETGVPMVFMGHLVSGFPIVAVVGLPRAEILGGAVRQLFITVGILLVTTCLILLLVLHLKRSIDALDKRDSEYRTLFDNAGVSIFLISGYRFVEMNQKTYDVFQLAEGESPADLKPWDVSPSVQPDGSSSEVLAREHIDQARKSGQVTFRWWHKRLQSGEEFPAQVSLSVLGNDHSHRLLAVVHDLSDVERARAALAELNADLERRVRARTEDVERANKRLALANEELEMFAASASHDLRSPLGTIAGMAGLLKLELDEGRRDTSGLRLGRIQDGVRRMAEIIDGLLALSRATGHEGEAAAVDLGGMASEIVDELRKQYRERVVETDFETGLIVLADPRLMRTLLTNLLENAWKYTSKVSAPRVELRRRRLPAGGSEYEVRDNGVGFDMRYADKLFKPFRRLHSVQEFPGMGLGLATVARIVRRYGGEIRGESSMGQGAVFRFTLPAAERAT